MSLSLVIFAGIFTPKGVFAVTNITSNIAANTTWTTASSTFVIQNSITVNSGVTLTIQPGVVVKFKATSTNLTVAGKLNALGTATSSIYFTAYKDDAVGGDTNGDGATTTPFAGNWGYIKINATASTSLNYVTIRYGGSSSYMVDNYGGKLDIQNSVIATSSKSGIWPESGTTTISNTTINGNGDYGVKAISSGVLSITSSTFYDNKTAAGTFNFGTGLKFTNSGNTNLDTGTGKRGFIVSGTVNTNTTWQGGIPYIISGIFSVGSGSTLTVNPNTIVKLDSISAYIQVTGTLTAIGVSTYPIYFTSIKDDSIGGDTDNSATTTPQAGDWNYITITGSGTATFNYCTVRYGGYSNSYANINNGGGTLNISSSTISNAKYYGIKQGTGATTNLTQSSLFGNGTLAFNNTATATTTATNNYWGDLSGPYNAKYNSSGSGNAVSDKLTFWPWFGQTHYLNAYNSVDRGERMDWEWGATSTQTYATEANTAISLWNSIGGVDIEPDDIFHLLDLTLYEVDNPDLPVGAYYGPDDKIEYNKHFMSSYPSALNQYIVTHELGHALGLDHSYIGNIMYFSATMQTSLGTQDVSDHSYCWISDNCTPQNF